MADTAAQRACSYILDRIQVDPDLHYYAGPLTETFHLLCLAQAEYTGQPLAEIKLARAKDLQPEYRKREPQVLAFKARLDSVAVADIETLRADRDYFKAAYSRKLDDEKRALEAAQGALAENASLKEQAGAVSAAPRLNAGSMSGQPALALADACEMALRDWFEPHYGTNDIGVAALIREKLKDALRLAGRLP